MALRMTDAVWNPPVQRTGTVTACLILRASGRLAPSILSAGTPAWSHCSLKIGPVTAPRNKQQVAERMRHHWTPAVRRPG